MGLETEEDQGQVKGLTPWLVAAGAILAVGRVKVWNGRIWIRVTDRKVIPGPYPITEEPNWMPLDDPKRRYFETLTGGFAPYYS